MESGFPLMLALSSHSQSSGIQQTGVTQTQGAWRISLPIVSSIADSRFWKGPEIFPNTDLNSPNKRFSITTNTCTKQWGVSRAGFCHGVENQHKGPNRRVNHPAPLSLFPLRANLALQGWITRNESHPSSQQSRYCC